MRRAVRRAQAAGDRAAAGLWELPNVEGTLSAQQALRCSSAGARAGGADAQRERTTSLRTSSGICAAMTSASRPLVGSFTWVSGERFRQDIAFPAPSASLAAGGTGLSRPFAKMIPPAAVSGRGIFFSYAFCGSIASARVSVMAARKKGCLVVVDDVQGGGPYGSARSCCPCRDRGRA